VEMSTSIFVIFSWMVGRGKEKLYHRYAHSLPLLTSANILDVPMKNTMEATFP
jgi:hypothetical protein